MLKVSWLLKRDVDFHTSQQIPLAQVSRSCSVHSFMAVLGFCCRAPAFSSCGKRPALPLWCVGASLWWLLCCTGSRTLGLSSCDAWPQMPGGMWDLPGPGMEPMSPALAGGFLTPGPQGSPLHSQSSTLSSHCSHLYLLCAPCTLFILKHISLSWFRPVPA